MHGIRERGRCGGGRRGIGSVPDGAVRHVLPGHLRAVDVHDDPVVGPGGELERRHLGGVLDGERAAEVGRQRLGALDRELRAQVAVPPAQRRGAVGPVRIVEVRAGPLGGRGRGLVAVGPLPASGDRRRRERARIHRLGHRHRGGRRAIPRGVHGAHEVAAGLVESGQGVRDGGGRGDHPVLPQHLVGRVVHALPAQLDRSLAAGGREVLRHGRSGGIRRGEAHERARPLVPGVLPACVGVVAAHPERAVVRLLDRPGSVAAAQAHLGAVLRSVGTVRGSPDPHLVDVLDPGETGDAGPLPCALVHVLGAVAARGDPVLPVGRDGLEVTAVLGDVGAQLLHRGAVVAEEHVLGAAEPHAVADLRHRLLVAQAPSRSVREVHLPGDDRGVLRGERPRTRGLVRPLAQAEVARRVDLIPVLGGVDRDHCAVEHGVPPRARCEGCDVQSADVAPVDLGGDAATGEVGEPPAQVEMVALQIHRADLRRYTAGVVDDAGGDRRIRRTGHGVEHGEGGGGLPARGAEGAAHGDPSVGQHRDGLDLVVQGGAEGGEPLAGRHVEGGQVALLDASGAVRIALHVAEVAAHVHHAVRLREIGDLGVQLAASGRAESAHTPGGGQGVALSGGDLCALGQAVIRDRGEDVLAHQSGPQEHLGEGARIAGGRGRCPHVRARRGASAGGGAEAESARPALRTAHRGVHALVRAAGAEAAGVPAPAAEGVHLPGGHSLQACELPGPVITRRGVAEANLLPRGAVRAQRAAQPHSFGQLVHGAVVQQPVHGVGGQLRRRERGGAGGVLCDVGGAEPALVALGPVLSSTTDQHPAASIGALIAVELLGCSELRCDQPVDPVRG